MAPEMGQEICLVVGGPLHGGSRGTWSSSGELLDLLLWLPPILTYGPRLSVQSFAERSPQLGYLMHPPR